MKNNSTKIIVLIIILLILVIGVFFIYNKLSTGSNANYKNNTESNNTKLLTNEEAIAEGKKLYDKATEIYETWMLTPYCGINLDSIDSNDKNVEELGDSEYGNGEYYKSNFTSLDDLKNYLKQWLSEDIVNSKIVKSSESNGETYYKYVEDVSLLSKSDDHYSYVDYVLKDNRLYCRLDVGKGWLSLYQDKYDIKVDKIEENKITYTITSTYCNSHDSIDSNNSCNEKDLKYKDTKFIIARNSSNNFVVTEYTLHD